MTASGRPTLSPITSGAGTPAQSYCAAARHFFKGVEVLSKGSAEVAPACAFLAAQSLECALKAYLSHVGASESYLKHHSRRHNLEALWTEASAKGLNIPAQPSGWCVILNQTHNAPYYLRYPIGINGFQTPAPTSMAAELDALLALVTTVV